MSKYRRHNWQKLFAEFEQSGLSQVEFCKQHNINPKYFSLKRSRREAQNSGAFVEANVSSEPVSHQGLVLQVGNCKIHCPESMPITSFISLVQSLA